MSKVIRRASVLVLVLCACACGKKAKTGEEAAPAKDAAQTSTSGGAATAATTKQAPPADVPAFLDRFCAAVSSGDKAYVAAHTENGTFSSEQATDPAKCGGRTGKRCFTRLGGQHAQADFQPVCARIQAQPRAQLAKSVHEKGGALRARLADADLVSELVIERQGSDFRLLREVKPGT